ncbi:MAG: hypothetical protein QNJ94_04315 [Alphaproteobacteria bacterium]|nr:hypothetical protein [Alphaproteobacteria bacterium]
MSDLNRPSRTQRRAVDLLMVIMATAGFGLTLIATQDIWLAALVGGVVLGLMLISVYLIGDRQRRE